MKRLSGKKFCFKTGSKCVLGLKSLSTSSMTQSRHNDTGARQSFPQWTMKRQERLMCFPNYAAPKFDSFNFVSDTVSLDEQCALLHELGTGISAEGWGTALVRMGDIPRYDTWMVKKCDSNSGRMLLSMEVPNIRGFGFIFCASFREPLTFTY